MILSSFLTVMDGVRHRGRARTWPPDQATGRRGEDIAHRYLERHGMLVVARNYRMETGAGEIDIVGWDHGTLVFVEVKTRTGEESGAPDRAVGAEKERSFLRASRDYARRAGVSWDTTRFDLVSVVLRSPPAITHHRDVLEKRPQ